MADLSVQTELSAEDLNRIIDGVAMRLNGRPSLSPAALNGIETANYLGISRARFYEILEVEKELAAAAITIGSKRIWPVVFLNHWLDSKKGQSIKLIDKKKSPSEKYGLR